MLQPPLVIVTPNISEQMGGEAIKAFQFIDYLVRNGRQPAVIAHRRSASVMEKHFPSLEVHYVEDSTFTRFLAKTPLLQRVAALGFFRAARGIIKRILRDRPNAIFHYLCPVSPVLLRFPVQNAFNVIGPLTGNIYYPPAFSRYEPVTDVFRREAHFLIQKFIGFVSADKRRFRRVLISGGERTRRSLQWAGCDEAVMLDVVDSGISKIFDDHPKIEHSGTNFRFMTSGRLVPHKGVQLTIKALQYVKQPIQFDIFGDGRYRTTLENLAREIGVTDKVRFLGWLESHDDLITKMQNYRGYMVPSLAEANGIVVQEAMMAGLPVVCLRWGGPTMLADDESAIFIDPVSEEQVCRDIAAAMDRLAVDPDWAASLTARARAIAERRFRWDRTVAEWSNAYTNVNINN